MSVKYKVGSILLLAVIIIMAIGYLSFRSLSTIVETIHLDNDTNFILDHVKDIANDMEQAERGVRVFTIIGDDKYLIPYYNNIIKVNQKIKVLQVKCKDDTSYRGPIDSLSRLIQEKLKLWNEILVLYNNYDLETKLKDLTRRIDSISTLNQTDSAKRNFIYRLFNKKRTIESKANSSEKILEQIGDLNAINQSVKMKKEEKELQLSRTNIQINKKIYDLIDLIEKKEDQKLAQKAYRADKLSKETYFWIFAFTIFGTAIAMLGLLIFTRFLKKSNEYQKALKDSKQKAEELVKAKELFIANVSHELRTPLNAISGYTEQLLKLPDLKNDYLNIIRFSSDHLLHLIDDLLDYSKLQAGKLKLSPVHYKIRELVAGLCSMIQVQAQKNNVTLKTNIHNDIPDIVYGDPLQYKKILINILGNAIKFSPNGKVELTLSADGSKNDIFSLITRVKDDGIGIDSENIKKIFEGFTQENNDVSRKYGGTGLGLTIVKNLVELHKGKIDVESEKYKGTLFTIQLPYKKGNINNVKENANEVDLPNLNGMLCLVVDDSEYNRKLVKVILEKWGAKVNEASNGGEAVECIKNKDYDMVFLDMRMPVLDGAKTAKFIRQGLKGKDNKFPVFILSALNKEEYQSRIKGLEINGIISKPITEKSIKDAVKEWAKEVREPEIRTVQPQQTSKNSFTILDVANLYHIANNDEKFVHTMLEKLIETSNKEFDNLKKAIQVHDWLKVADTAHKIASPCRHVGAKKLTRQLKEIESFSRNKTNTEQVFPNYKKAKNEYMVLKNEIITYLNQ